MSADHPIKTRFLAAPEFQELYAREYAYVYNALFGEDYAGRELARLTDVVASSSLMEPDKLAKESAAVRKKLEEQAAMGPVPVPAATPVAGSATPVATPAAATPVAREEIAQQ